jgi:arsenite oxidase small subunit
MMSEENPKDCKECGKKNPRWREDFPVQWENDNYITRREMVKFLALGSVLLAGANAVVAAIPHFEKMSQFPQLHVTDASAIAANGSFLFRYPTKDDPCLMVRTNDGKLLAYSQVCTHLSCAVIHKAEDNSLFCPCHNGYFTVDEGRPYAGPPTRPLPRIKLEQRGEQIFAVGVEV